MVNSIYIYMYNYVYIYIHIYIYTYLTNTHVYVVRFIEGYKGTQRGYSRGQWIAMGVTITGWWFGTFFMFLYIGNNHPNWLIFFRGVQTTNQIIYSVKNVGILLDIRGCTTNNMSSVIVLYKKRERKPMCQCRLLGNRIFLSPNGVLFFCRYAHYVHWEHNTVNRWILGYIITLFLIKLKSSLTEKSSAMYCSIGRFDLHFGAVFVHSWLA